MSQLVSFADFHARRWPDARQQILQGARLLNRVGVKAASDITQIAIELGAFSDALDRARADAEAGLRLHDRAMGCYMADGSVDESAYQAFVSSLNASK